MTIATLYPPINADWSRPIPKSGEVRTWRGESYAELQNDEKVREAPGIMALSKSVNVFRMMKMGNRTDVGVFLFISKA